MPAAGTAIVPEDGAKTRLVLSIQRRQRHRVRLAAGLGAQILLKTQSDKQMKKAYMEGWGFTV